MMSEKPDELGMTFADQSPKLKLKKRDTSGLGPPGFRLKEEYNHVSFPDANVKLPTPNQVVAPSVVNILPPSSKSSASQMKVINSPGLN